MSPSSVTVIFLPFFSATAGAQLLILSRVQSPLATVTVRAFLSRLPMTPTVSESIPLSTSKLQACLMMSRSALLLAGMAPTRRLWNLVPLNFDQLTTRTTLASLGMRSMGPAWTTGAPGATLVPPLPPPPLLLHATISDAAHASVIHPRIRDIFPPGL